MNYYEHHLGDYAAATAHLSWDEDMAYTRLLRAYYHHERGIQEGQQYRLARACTPSQRKAVDVVLAEFFSLVDGYHMQKRADEEIARCQDKQRKAKASADARWSHTERNAKAMRTHSEGNAPSLQTPDTIREVLPPSGVQGVSKARGSKTCPESFLVTTELQAWARFSVPRVDIRAETAIFRTQTFATARSDWPKTWQGWMLREHKRLAEASKRDASRGGLIDGESAKDRAARLRAEEISAITARKVQPMTLVQEYSLARLENA